MDLRPLTRIDIPQWADLLACCFNQSSTHMQHLISWLYCLGDLEAYGIWDNNKLIAQYTCLHRTILVNGQIVPVGMSMNMAVHPDYRGQGLIKHVSQPVYETLCNKDVMLGIGFSNAQGVKVDKHSKGYGYQVIGQMHSIITPTREFKRPSLKLSDTICEKQVILADLTTQLNQFYKKPDYILQRYVQHPFRQYRYAIWQEDHKIDGIIVYKPVTLLGIPAVALLDVFSNHPEELLMRWSTTLKQHQIHLIHTLATPQSHIKFTLKNHFLSVKPPITRNPYYLTIKPLSHELDVTLFDFANWDLIGGDVL